MGKDLTYLFRGEVEKARIDAFLLPPAQFMREYNVTRREWRAWCRDTLRNYEATSEYILIHKDKIPNRIKPFIPCIELILETYRDDYERSLKSE